MDFKVSYLDAGLPNSYFTESDQLMSSTSPVTPHNIPATPSRVNRRYKTQLRDFLSTCRTKRKLSQGNNTTQMTPTTSSTVSAPVMNPMPTVDYITTDAAAAAYNMYTTPYPPPAATDHSLSSYMSHSNFQHGLYTAPTALDNRYLTSTENIFHQYRPLGSYYPEYHHTTTTTPYVGNGFLDMPSRAASCTMPTYDPSTGAPGAYQLSSRMPVDEKLYSCQQVVDPSSTTKYPTYVDSSRGYVVANTAKCLDVSWPYSVSPSSGIIQPIQVMGQKVVKHPASVDGMSTHSEVASPVNNGILTPKMEEMKADHINSMSQQNSVSSHHFSPATTTSSPEVTRQTVLMWGSGSNHMQHTSSSSNNSRSPPSDPGTPTIMTSGHYTTVCNNDPLKSLAEMNSIGGTDICKWNGSAEGVKSEAVVTTVAGSQPGSPALGNNHQQHSTHHNHQNSRVVMVL